MIDRGDYWQCAYVFPKGEVEAMRARGLEAFRAEVARAAHDLAEVSRDNELGRCEIADRRSRSAGAMASPRPARHRRCRPCHVARSAGSASTSRSRMRSPLPTSWPGPWRGAGADLLLAKVRKRRLLAVRAEQGFQNAAQKRIITPLLARRTGARRIALAASDASPLSRCCGASRRPCSASASGRTCALAAKFPLPFPGVEKTS